MYQSDPQSILNYKEDTALDTEEAAKLIPCQSSTLKKSRHTGNLFGVTAPQYQKRGRRVFYQLSTLREWLGQFSTYNNTSQYAGGES